MKNYYWVIAAVAIMFMGFLCGRNSVKMPELVATAQGIDTVKISVPGDTVRDTLYKVKWYPRTVRDTEWVASGTPTITNYEQRCFDFSTTSRDSVTISGTACSKDFPVKKPLDLTIDISKITPSRTVKEIITVSDTAYFEKPHFWRDVKIFGIGCGIGITAGAIGAILIGR